ncbi:MAG TPA: hypothetical protein VGB15_19350 [Longimicrobium sp.]|jgi:hypothetical protein
MRLLRLLPFALIWPGALTAQGVTAENGNLFYRHSPATAPRRITALGLDSQPQMSADGRHVVFVRATPGDSVETALGWRQATALWTVGIDGSQPRMILRGRGSTDPERTLADFQKPMFSPDGRWVYFLSSAWATSAAVHTVDVASGQERFVAPGNSLDVLYRGKYAGHLLVSQHRYFLGGGSYDWFWLIAPDGKEVGPVGETEAAVEQFLATALYQ